MGTVCLGRPVAYCLYLAGGAHRGTAADVDPVADLDRPRIATRLFPLLLGIDIAPRLRRPDDGLSFDLDQHLRTHQTRDAEQGRGRTDVSQRLDPRPGVLRCLRQIRDKSFRIDNVTGCATRLIQSPEDGV